MALQLKELAANPRLLEDLRARGQSCSKCGTPLQETLTGKRRLSRGDACSDCFYEELGALVEQHPIASAGKRRT